MPKELKALEPRWAGQTVVCIASGPSLTQEDVDLVKESWQLGRCKVIAVNREFETAPWADVLYAADLTCWREYIEDIRKIFGGELWTLDRNAASLYKLNLVGRETGDGLSRDPSSITTGGNSGYQAVHLAASWGASRVLLLGYDMQATGGKDHHYGKHRGKLPNGKGFSQWVARFKPLVIDLKRKGITITNLTRETAIPEEWIPRSNVEDFQW